MNVLIVSTYDQQGGAAIAAYRLLEALNKNGVAAQMLTINKQSDNPHVIEIGSPLINKARFIAERALIYIQNGFSKKNLFDVSVCINGVAITQHDLFKKADVIHLHWINQGMLSLREIRKIVASGKKIVWTMHDMWPLTGICHHAGECTHYQNYCGMCPYLRLPQKKDLSYSTFLLKEAAYSFGKIHFVACSNWLKRKALKSNLTTYHAVNTIANPLNTELYTPTIDKTALRIAMSLPTDKKIILFAAAKVSDKRKGIDYLVEASRIISHQNNNILFLIAGQNSQEIIAHLELPAIGIGYVAAADMPNVYNAADLFVTPSLQENLPNTIMEAMACGTPCVGFNIGGIPEMIDHKSNGYIANYKDPHDLAHGLLWVIKHLNIKNLAIGARRKAVENYSQGTIAKKYIDIYTKE